MSATAELAARHLLRDNHASIAGGNTLDRDHEVSAAHQPRVSVNLPVAADHVEVGSQIDNVAGGGKHVREALLLILADALDDFERVRIATQNRIRALTDDKGIAGSPEHTRMVALLDGVKALEHDAELQLRRAMRVHPLGPFVRRTVGLGEKQAARLLAAIGDPYVKPAVIDGETGDVIEDARPRTVSELWALCGYHVIDGEAARRRRGARANWSSAAKTRAFLVAESCIKQAASPYRATYDAARTKYADSTHPTACVRCGRAHRPAPAGSPLTLGHQHARALRLVAKEILKDLWHEAKEVASC